MSRQHKAGAITAPGYHRRVITLEEGGAVLVQAQSLCVRARRIGTTSVRLCGDAIASAVWSRRLLRRPQFAGGSDSLSGGPDLAMFLRTFQPQKFCASCIAKITDDAALHEDGRLDEMVKHGVLHSDHGLCDNCDGRADLYSVR